MDRWAHGIAVAVANMPDAEEAYGGALAVAKALRAATNITNVEVLKTVMDIHLEEVSLLLEFPTRDLLYL